MTTTEALWSIVVGGRNGILATIDSDGIPQMTNIYYLVDPDSEVVRFSTTTDRVKGRNLIRSPRASLHVAGKDFLNFAVVAGSISVALPEEADDAAVEKLFDIHRGLGATSARVGFGEQMLIDRRMAVELRVERIYGQILDRTPRAHREDDQNGTT